VDEDVLSEADKRRFLDDVKDNIWVKRDNGDVLKQIRAELAELDRDEPSVVGVEDSHAHEDPEQEREDTEGEEEEEVVERP
jgi:hypothetical protein